MNSKKSRSWIWWVILGILALCRLASATERSEIKKNLDDNTLYADCRIPVCPDGVPIYNDVKLPNYIVTFVPNNTFCDVNSFYPAGEWKDKLEEEHGDNFSSDAYYQIDCDGVMGWIPAVYTSRTKGY